jgi:hypothetical protein
MEALILIPIVAIIYGWAKTIPAGMASPPGVNGFDSDDIHAVNGFCSDFVENDDLSTDDDFDLFHSDNMSFCDGGFSSSLFDDSPAIDGHMLLDDLLYNPAYEWFEANIYHHHDDHISDCMNSFSDPFPDITDSISITSFDD